MITPKQRSLIGFAALLGIAATQACGSDASAPDNVSTAGANTGSLAGSSAMGVSGGGAAGASSAGAPGAGMSSGSAGRSFGGGGAAAGSGSAAGGAGGASAGAGTGGRAAGGAGGRSGGAGGSAMAPAFSDVASILGTACAGAACHGGTAHTNLTNMTGLHMRLTSPLPTTAPHCKGTTLIVANNAASSYLLQIVQGRAACMNNGATEMVGPMPLSCSKTSANPRACLTTAQIKTLTDWVGAGAPQ